MLNILILGDILLTTMPKNVKNKVWKIKFILDLDLGN